MTRSNESGEVVADPCDPDVVAPFERNTDERPLPSSLEEIDLEPSIVLYHWLSGISAPRRAP